MQKSKAGHANSNIIYDNASPQDRSRLLEDIKKSVRMPKEKEIPRTNFKRK